jgi:hypothetical protein
MKYLKRFNESHFDLADDIANDLYPRFLKLRNEGEVITPEYFENYMKERGAKSDIIDDVMSSLVNLGFDFGVDNDIESNDEESVNPFERWESSEDLQADLENYIGKKIEDFEYADKLKAYKYVENNSINFFHTLNSDDENLADIKQQITDFLANLKEYFEL